MKIRIVVAAVGLALAAAASHAQQAPEAAALPSSGPAAGATYVVDPTHTFVIYEIGHYGTTTNRGRFSTKDGSVRIDASGSGGSVEVTMDIGTINTGVELLNRHLLSKDFFNAAAYPTARFVADRVVVEGGKIRSASGTLTMLGKARPVVLTAKRFNCYVSPMVNRQVCGGDFETTIKRSEFGITWGVAFGFEDDVKLLVQVEAIVVQPG